MDFLRGYKILLIMKNRTSIALFFHSKPPSIPSFPVKNLSDSTQFNPFISRKKSRYL